MEKSFTDWSLVLRPRTPQPQISRTKLSRVAQNREIRKSFLTQKFPAIQYNRPAKKIEPKDDTKPKIVNCR